MGSWPEVQARLRALPKVGRIRAWDRVDAAQPRPTGLEYYEWLLTQLDAAVAAEENGDPIEVLPEKRKYAAWPAPCVGTHLEPAKVIAEPRTRRLPSGAQRTSPGRGRCPECGRLGAFNTDTGMRRHSPNQHRRKRDV